MGKDGKGTKAILFNGCFLSTFFMENSQAGFPNFSL